MPWFKKKQFTLLQSPTPGSPTGPRVPDGLCVKCPKCDAIHLTRHYVENLRVCSHCKFHDKVPIWERIGQITDPDTFVEMDANMISGDPLGFTDSKRYPDRIAQYQKRTGFKDAVITGKGAIMGLPVSLAFMNFGFIGGSMGSVVGEKVTRSMEYALEKKVPSVVFCTSGGARMQEGILSLMQMAKTSALVGKLNQAGVPYVTVLTDPTTAGVMASFASLGDLIIAEPDALIGFAGPRVIEQTIRQVLPKGFQRAEFVQEHGFVDMIVSRHDLRKKLGSLLAMMTHQQLQMDETEELAEQKT
ncbi:MAG: acetyl-CoA carboxylase, carboxyltransferase subunit beta [Candidatus Sumerlaeia bacterium]